MVEDKHKKQCEDRKLNRQDDHIFKIDDTPENVAKALFTVNPNEKGFEWEYMKQAKLSSESRADDAVQ